MTWLEILVGVLGALGGLDLLKWFYNAVVNRKNNSRIADAEADASEFHVLQEEMVFLQEQVKEKEIRFAEQTTHLRQVQRELLELEKEKSVMEVGYIKQVSNLELELERKRCDDITCPFRQPPTAHTQAVAGLTKKTYFKNKANDTTEGTSASV